MFGYDNGGSGSASGSSVIIIGPNGSKYTWTYISELVTIAAAATTLSAANLIPANANILAVTGRVTTVIPTAVTFSVGITGDATLFGSGISVAANTTFGTFDSAVLLSQFMNASATQILITPSSSPAAATGRVRLVVYYAQLTAPTS